MPAVKSSPRPPLIGALMRMPVDAVYRRMLADLHDAGFTDLVPAHFAVLRYPGPDDRRPSDLAIEAGMTRQAMNYLLGQLEQSGYLVRQEDAVDGRSKRIQLTERGNSVGNTIRRDRHHDRGRARRTTRSSGVQPAPTTAHPVERHEVRPRITRNAACAGRVSSRLEQLQIPVASHAPCTSDAGRLRRGPRTGIR